MGKKLRILHVFRSPVGGIFRHVKDLCEAHGAEGHQLGLICDNNTGGPFEEDNLRKLVPSLDLGLHRMAMNRALGPSDLLNTFRLLKIIKRLQPDIIHTHGAKGGAYGRLATSLVFPSSQRPKRLYCPHGGSIHYSNDRLSHRLYFLLERAMLGLTDQLIFVSGYERDGFVSKVGNPKVPAKLVANGVSDDEFSPVKPNADASDFLFIGMMRDLKGVDVLLDALELIGSRTKKDISVTLVGDGPDLDSYKAIAEQLPPSVSVKFKGPTPARKAFALGKTLVIPSRAESMPYIILEALAAHVPVITTAAGGIPEIYGPYSNVLVEPGNATALAAMMERQLQQNLLLVAPEKMSERIKTFFSIDAMSHAMLDAYYDVVGVRGD